MLLKSQSLSSNQTVSNSVQFHNACKGSSKAKEKRSHVGSVMMVRRTRFFFEATVFLYALQMKFMILFGVRKDQTPFHKSFTLSWLLSCLYSSISPFKNLYPDLQVYLPSPVIAQKILSSNSLRPKGIFLMDEVSCGVNMPSIMFVLLGKNPIPLNVYV